MSEARAATPVLVLRRTRADDLDAVLEIERHPENSPFIGQWPREQHEAVIADPSKEHWVIATSDNGAAGGYLIAYDLVGSGFGIWVQRLAVTRKSIGVGRAVLQGYLASALPRLGADRAYLDVMQVNQRGQRAYRAAGFVEASMCEDERALLASLVGGMDDDVIVMRADRDTLTPLDGVEVQIVE